MATLESQPMPHRQVGIADGAIMIVVQEAVPSGYGLIDAEPRSRGSV